MTDKEYQIKLREIQVDYDAKRLALVAQYVTENTKYNPGDIAEDHYHKIKITSLFPRVWQGGSIDCVYTGIVLKKDNTPAKNQSDVHMYGSNIIGGWKK